MYSIKTMNIRQFEYVLAVAEHRHFETAAEKCFVTQSTLSAMISKLESELGIIIFDRRKKPVDITKEGEKIIEHLKIISTEINRLDELSKEIKGAIKGVIKIGCIPTVAPFLLPIFLPDFSTKYPDLIMEIKEITTDEIIRRLKSRELDIGIISFPINDDELAEYPIYREPFVFYDTSRTSEKEINTEDILLDNFWLLEEGHCLRNQVLAVCSTENKKINSSLNIKFKAGSIDSLIRFVRANNGKTLLPYLAAINFSDEEKKHIRYFSTPVPFRNVGLLTHRYFVKKTILRLLQEEIRRKIKLTDRIEISDEIKQY